MASFRKGDQVYVFYRVSKSCREDRKYLAMMDQRHGVYRPRTGMSDGWVPAVVVAEAATPNSDVQIAYQWPHFFTQRGHMADRDPSWTELYAVSDVMLCEAATGPSRPLHMPGSQPELGILTFRWGGSNEVSPPAQWGKTGSSVSDLFINSFLDMAVMPEMGNNFEVWTVYVEDKGDINRLADTAHLIFGPNHPVRRARHVCAMFHLYPTGFEENCIPNRETGDDGGAALVDQSSLFRLIRAVERAGIPSRFPHCSGFYEVLASKRWTYMMALSPELRVPPTVAVPRMLIEQDLDMAADFGLSALNAVKCQQAAMRQEPAPSKDSITKGVAKLGFSWEALDVKFWEKEEGLRRALDQLTQTIEISSEVTGQPHDLESVIVQEYVKHDLEMRLYVIEGKVENIIYTKFCKIKDNLEFGDFHELFSHEVAANQWMGGDSAALANGEQQCRKCIAHWMHWVWAQTSEVPPGIRFDFFIARGAKEGEASIWTLEICELGFSMLGEDRLPMKVFSAMLRSMLRKGKRSLPPMEEVANVAWPVPAAVPPTPLAAAKAAAAAAAPAQKAQPAVKVEAKKDADPTAPPTLYVTIGRCQITPDQRACAGKYNLVEGQWPNDMPLWMNDKGDRWIFFGTNDYWYFGDWEEYEAKFAVGQGYFRHKAQGDVSPDKLVGYWEKGEDWTQEPALIVAREHMAPPRVPSAKGPKSKAKKSGSS